jgi:hypothetical protein
MTRTLFFAASCQALRKFIRSMLDGPNFAEKNDKYGPAYNEGGQRSEHKSHTVAHLTTEQFCADENDQHPRANCADKRHGRRSEQRDDGLSKFVEYFHDGACANATGPPCTTT